MLIRMRLFPTDFLRRVAPSMRSGFLPVFDEPTGSGRLSGGVPLWWTPVSNTPAPPTVVEGLRCDAL